MDPTVPEPPISPKGPSQRFPTWKQALLIFAGGIVLAVSACFGFVISASSNFERGGGPFTPLAALLFVAGAIVTVVGAVLVIIRMVRSAIHPGEKRPPASQGEA